ncbi:MAG: redox-sensing transcriptional repressor Rex [SAR202 cluster bacterium]|nr:redox-sensing transcriptional repressor Rex [SAR202 cluster bacterium]|tara:strand:+ start:3490 stop:4146 length:657 start_codon:yes stop_codon:yes gene_type:complete
MSDSRIEVPEVVVERLPQYLRALLLLEESRIEVISSQELGALLQVTPAQIRKDFSYFGKFGKQGSGYDVNHLVEQLRQILGLHRTWNVAVVGVGRLGRSIISYPGFQSQGFRVVCAFESSDKLIGQMAGGLLVHDFANFKEVSQSENVNIAIVAVPASAAQDVIDQLVEGGIRAILNYAPKPAIVPSNVKIRNVDPVISLQSMTYHLNNVDQNNGTDC